MTTKVGLVDARYTKNEPRQRGGACYRQDQNFKEAIRQRDNNTCQLCGEPGKDVDHIIPHAGGGLSTPNNLRVLCHRCNCQTRRQRRDAAPAFDEWIASLEAERGEKQPSAPRGFYPRHGTYDHRD